MSRDGQLSASTVRRYWVCMAVDCIGYGMFLPLSLLYFHRVTGLPLARAGIILTIAALLGMSSNALAGSLVDRYGARTVLAGGYLVRAAGFGAYALVTNQAEMLVTTTLVAFGTASFQTAIQAFVADISRGPTRDRMIAAQRSIRNAGLGAGALIASAVISLHSTAAYHAIVLTSGAAFLAAALIVIRIPASYPVAAGTAPVHQPAAGTAPTQAGPAQPAGKSHGGYLTVLRNRPFMLLAAATFPVALGYLVLEVTLPVFITQVLHKPTSWAGVMFAINTAGIALLQLPVTRSLAGFRRTRACALGQLIFAAAFGLYGIAAIMHGGPLELADLFAGTVLFTVAELLHGATSSALTTSAAPEQLRGRYLAVFQFSWTIPQAIAPAVLTALLVFSPAALWLLLITGVVVSAVYIVRLEPRLPLHAVHPILPATSPPPAATPESATAA